MSVLPRIGVMVDRDRAPEELAAFAAGVQEAGADDLWVVEDLGWTGSISAAAIALAATEQRPDRDDRLLEQGQLAGRLGADLAHPLGHAVSQPRRRR